MTAMFIIIFLENIRGKHSNVYPALVGIGVSVISLLVFGKDGFILPAMIGIVAVLLLLHTPLSKNSAKVEKDG